MANYEISEPLQELAAAVIDEHETLHHLSDALDRIIFMTSDKAKRSRGRTVFADTELVRPKLRDLADCDFIITFYKPATDGMTDEQLKRLMYHELRHVGADAEKPYIVPHDLQDFRDIVGAWGIDWIRG